MAQFMARNPYVGYEVTTCASGDKAVELYKTSMESGIPFLTVIMDLTIPGGIGGKESAEQILSLFPKACLIVSSGYSNGPIMSSYQEYGFRGAIAKPYNIHEVKQVGAKLKDREFSLIDIGIAAEHFCLQAAELGLGTCMLGWFDEAAIQKILAIPEKIRIGLVITLGYASEDCPLRTKIRKNVKDMCRFNSY